jgi:hypothetical protein
MRLHPKWPTGIEFHPVLLSLTAFRVALRPVTKFCLTLLRMRRCWP